MVRLTGAQVVLTARAVAPVRQLGLEAVEPLPVVDSHGDGEAEHEDGDDNADHRPGTPILPVGLEGGRGGQWVLLPDSGGTVGA